MKLVRSRGGNRSGLTTLVANMLLVIALMETPMISVSQSKTMMKWLWPSRIHNTKSSWIPNSSTVSRPKSIDEPIERLPETAGLVRKPKSIGRWKTFEKDKVYRVMSLGKEYLQEFGYS